MEIARRAESIIPFREEVLSLQTKWATQFYVDEQPDRPNPNDLDNDSADVSRRSMGRLQRGMRTREQEFRSHPSGFEGQRWLCSYERGIGRTRDTDEGYFESS